MINAIDTHAPLKVLSRKQRKLKLKPWITKSILVYIKKKQNFFKSHFLNGSDAHKQFYTKYTNKLTKLKFASKKTLL